MHIMTAASRHRRAIMVQLGFFFHMKLATGASSLSLTRPLIFAISFMLLFSVVIALFKDIPDVKGDAQVSNCAFTFLPLNWLQFVLTWQRNNI